MVGLLSICGRLQRSTIAIDVEHGEQTLQGIASLCEIEVIGELYEREGRHSPTR